MSAEQKKKKEQKATTSKAKSSKSNKKLVEMEKKIESLELDLAESKDKYIRLYAEFDNYKKRTSKERIELISTAGRETIAALLPVLDDFDRAKKSADSDESSEVFTEGVSLVYNKLNGLLQSKGLKAMESNGEEFDPEYHEAITEIPAPDKKLKGKIVDTIEKGYMLNNTIIRHAKVVVGK